MTDDDDPGTTVPPAPEEQAGVTLTAREQALVTRWVVRDADIHGGDPIIRGTRVSVYTLAERLAHGESKEVLDDDFPHVPAEAREAATLFGRVHSRPPAMSRLISVGEVAAALRISEDGVRMLARRGKLQTTTSPDGERMVPRAELDAFLRRVVEDLQIDHLSAYLARPGGAASDLSGPVAGAAQSAQEEPSAETPTHAVDADDGVSGDA